jgi:hypothetical protein
MLHFFLDMVPPHHEWRRLTSRRGPHPQQTQVQDAC